MALAIRALIISVLFRNSHSFATYRFKHGYSGILRISLGFGELEYLALTFTFLHFLLTFCRVLLNMYVLLLWNSSVISTMYPVDSKSRSIQKLFAGDVLALDRSGVSRHALPAPEPLCAFVHDHSRHLKSVACRPDTI